MVGIEQRLYQGCAVSGTGISKQIGISKRNLLRLNTRRTTIDIGYSEYSIRANLSFAQVGSDTVLTIADVNGSASGVESQKITFTNTNLFTDTGAANSAALVQALLDTHHLITTT